MVLSFSYIVDRQIYIGTNILGTAVKQGTGAEAKLALQTNM
jgi:hypothetical protein